MDFGQTLDSLGIKYKETAAYFSFSSPFRSDSNPSMVLYKDNGFVIDFGGAYKAPFSRFYFEVTGKHLTMDKQDWLKSFSSTYKRPSAQDKLNIEVTLDGGAVPAYENKEALTYCYSRGMTDTFIQDFGILYSDWCRINGTPFKKRLLIPIVEDGKIVSIEGRDVTREQTPKVLYPRGCSVSTLFNIDRLDRTQPLLIVEGIMDLVKIYQSLSKNVTALFGVGVKERQKQILNTFPHIVIFPDNDEPGQGLLDNFNKFFEHDFEVAQVPEKDPGDASVESLKTAYLKRVPFMEMTIHQAQIFEEERPSWEGES